MDLLHNIERVYGKTSLMGWQFAAEGNWDIAERVFYKDEADPEHVQIWLKKQTTDNIALEALFELTNGECFFFGVRISQLLPDEKISVVRQLLTTCKQDASLTAVVQILRHRLGNQLIAEGVPDTLELGVFDLWNRVKPLTVWKKSVTSEAERKIILPEDIGALTKKPDIGFAALHEPQVKPLMLEASWNRDGCSTESSQCWVSLPVSAYNKIFERYIISKDKYRTAAEVFIGQSVKL
jgi:hypothetical protein